MYIFVLFFDKKSCILKYWNNIEIFFVKILKNNNVNNNWTNIKKNSKYHRIITKLNTNSTHELNSIDRDNGDFLTIALCLNPTLRVFKRTLSSIAIFVIVLSQLDRLMTIHFPFTQIKNSLNWIKYIQIKYLATTCLTYIRCVWD